MRPAEGARSSRAVPWVEVAAPALEPRDVLRCIAGAERPFLLDGGNDADGLGRYSLAGCDPVDELVLSGDEDEAYRALEGRLARWREHSLGAPRPIAVGYLSYDLGARAVARRRGRELADRDPIGLPALDVALYPAVWRFDRATGRATIAAQSDADARALLRRLEGRPAPLREPGPISKLSWELPDEEYRARVERVLEYLAAGDVYQVNLSHRMWGDLGEQSPLSIFLRLSQRTPAPLGAYLATRAGTILGNSPELFVAVEGRRIETRPIKGTIRRSGEPVADRALAASLSTSNKDLAEHLMIVDLERNDLGRVAEIGSVAVEGFGRVVTLPTVHHLVSTVSARLRGDVTLAEILEATFPGGSITGAPKSRAIEIIDELEGSRRGVYCGALGWWGGDGSMALSLPIRTAVVRDGRLALSVGGGVVADSTPQGELDETRLKAEAFLRVLR